MPELPPPLQLWNLVTGHVLPRCLHVVAEAGVPDALHETPLSAEVLARAVDLDATSLHRLLRVLAAAGVFEARDGKWAHTPLSRMLRSDHPQSMRAFARMIGEPLNWSAIGELEHSARTGEAGVRRIEPEGNWAYYRRHPERRRIFDEAMTAKAHAEIEPVLAAYDFSRSRTVADIGGGRGHLLAAILGRHPAANGILFDLPDAISAVHASPRMTLMAGNFFEDSLPEADTYLLSDILHDWDDEKATSILTAIRKAAPRSAKLLILETVLPDEPGAHPANVLDILMLAITGGRERARAEHASLLSAAGFRLDAIMATTSPVSIVLARPI